ncbi:MAG: glycosyltransferase family 2 protein [bacterium]|nr:glycosyltransferase family 2 protein [bacterium]
MFEGKKISLVFPALNEEKNIAQAILDFRRTRLIDEVLVVNNNSTDRTSDIAKKSGAKVILEKKQGYGFALRRGLSEAKGDYIILCEPDGTFSAKDLPQLLSYLKGHDLVIGSRTDKNFIEPGANMGPLLRIGNITVAKFMQLILGTSNLSDCGCTFRIFKKALLNKINPFFTVGGSHFLPETIALTTLANGKIIEIPVHYKRRVGESKITGSFKRSIKVGMNMVILILKYKFNPPNLN